MPSGLPTALDVPPYAAVLVDPEDLAPRRRLRRSLGCDEIVVVALDPALEAGDVVVPFLPLSGLPVVPDAARPWLRLEVQGWEQRAVDACDAAGLLARAGAVEVDVAIADGIIRSPSLAWMTERLAPRYSLAMITPTHGDGATGVTWVARAVFAEAQPST